MGIVNRSGVSSMIGAQAVAKNAPDSYTLLRCTSPEGALNAVLYSTMGDNPTRDVAPVTQLAVSSLVLVVHPSLPGHSVRDYLALARAWPGELVYWTVTAGSPRHIAGERVKLLTGVKINHVPYTGGAPQRIDLIGGQVQSGFVAVPVVALYAKSGRVRTLVVTTARALAGFSVRSQPRRIGTRRVPRRPVVRYRGARRHAREYQCLA